jgi:hypothetical protein
LWFASQFESCVQVGPVGVGLQTPLSQVVPAAHGEALLHSARHWPSAHTLPAPHSLENLQRFDCETHRFCWQTSPLAQSVDAEQGQGPFVPPHAWHLPDTHALPAPQSARVVHSFDAGGSPVGAAHNPFRQTSPFWQSVSAEQVVVQPWSVQTEPGAQLVLPVQGFFPGEATGRQP